MLKTSRKVHSPAEKALLVGEIQRRYAKGHTSMRAAAEASGIGEATYYAWLKAGVKAPADARRYSPRRSAHERRQLVDAVDARVEAGDTIAAACHAAGVTDRLYRRWRQELRPLPLREVAVTALVPVGPVALGPVTFAPAEPEPARTLTLHAPGGYRVEGLDAAAVAAILRSLSC